MPLYCDKVTAPLSHKHFYKGNYSACPSPYNYGVNLLSNIG